MLVDRNSGKAGVRVIDSVTESMTSPPRSSILAASTLESTRLLLLGRELYSNGIANSSDVVGRYFSEHIMGPRATGYMPALKGTTPTNDDGRPVGIYIARFRNVTERHKGFLRGYGFQGRSGSAEYPDHAHTTPGFGAAFKKTVRDLNPAPISISAFGEVLARQNRVELDPTVKDAWGIRSCASTTFGENEKAMAADMADTAEEMLRRRRRRDHGDQGHPDRRLVDPRDGHGADGHRSEDLGHQRLRPGARREEPVHRRRQHASYRRRARTRPGRSWRSAGAPWTISRTTCRRATSSACGREANYRGEAA